CVPGHATLMTRTRWLCVIASLALVGCHPAAELDIASTSWAKEPTQPARDSASAQPDSESYFELPGTTEPSPGRVSEIAATVMHPVVRILVKPGDMVRTGQRLIELDSDEPEAEVRAKQAEVNELKSSLSKLKAMPRAEERAEARALLESAQ